MKDPRGGWVRDLGVNSSGSGKFNPFSYPLWPQLLCLLARRHPVHSLSNLHLLWRASVIKYFCIAIVIRKLSLTTSFLSQLTSNWGTKTILYFSFSLLFTAINVTINWRLKWLTYQDICARCTASFVSVVHNNPYMVVYIFFSSSLLHHHTNGSMDHKKTTRQILK